MTAAALGLVPVASAASGLSPAVEHVRVGGVTLGYRVAGPSDAPPLVLVMGFAGTMAEWDPALVDRLATRHRVIAFDNRGMGTSTWKPGVRLTISLMADDTARLIHALGLEQADVLGWSMGGYIAQQLALRHPDAVRRLVLASTDPGSPHAILPTAAVIAELTSPDLSEQELVSLIFPPTPAGRAAAGAYYRRLAEQPGIRHSWFAAPPAVVAAQAVANGERWYAPGHGAYPRLPQLRIPVLVGAGAEDVVVPPGNASLIASRVPNARRLLFPGAGHAFLFQDTSRFARSVLAFLSG